MSDAGPEAAGPASPPAVEHPEVAAALAEVRDLEATPLAEHHGRLSRAHELLHGVLHGDPSAG